MPAHFFYFIPAIVAYFLFMPYFRRGHVRSAYEYLERRFGTWARLYAAAGFLVFHDVSHRRHSLRRLPALRPHDGVSPWNGSSWYWASWWPPTPSWAAWKPSSTPTFFKVSP